MLAPNKEFRENCDRAIYVTGQINQELVDRLTPTINYLRLRSCDAVTIYIDSRGGSTFLAETIRRLIKAPSPDGGICKVITVVTGTAASAAADFLALGDYAIAHPHSVILYHGTQRAPDSAMTYEAASALASSLQDTNERFAVRLARRAFPRFCLRTSQFREEFREYVSQSTHRVLLPIGGLTSKLKEKLEFPNARLVAEAQRRQEAIEDLTISVTRHVNRFKKQPPYPRFEAEVLKGIIEYKIKVHRNDPWLLSVQGLSELTNDFKLLLDFHYGQQRKDLNYFLGILGELFLRDNEREEYEKVRPDEDARLAWMKEHVEVRLQPLWYFLVSLCRLLQTADYSFGPEEAYWLGLVDEVSGSGLPNVREMIEALPDPGSPNEEPTKPEPADKALPTSA